MEKGNILVRGKTAEFFEYGNDHVVKLYHSFVSEELIKKEYEIARLINGIHIVSPKAEKMVKIENRIGIVFEKVVGKSMLRLLEGKTTHVNKYAKILANNHAKIHNHITDQLCDQVEHFTKKISGLDKLDSDRKEKILDYLLKMPIGDSVCHGDFHPDNIIMVEDGVKIINWANAYIGHPASDFARTFVILESPNVPEGASFLFRTLTRASRKSFAKKYKTEFINLSGILEEELDMWLMIAAAVRLGDNMEDDDSWLFKIIDEGLKEL